MNKENVLALADFVEQRTDLAFNMRDKMTCLMAFRGKLFEVPEPDRHTDDAVLGLNRLQVLHLYYGVNQDIIRLSYITRSQAVATLRHFAETGSIDYAKFRGV